MFRRLKQSKRKISKPINLYGNNRQYACRQSNNDRNYTPPRVFAWLASFVSAAGFVGALQPDFSSKLTAYRTGTARFEAVFSVKIANVTPMTLPDGPNSGAPEPPSPVRASYAMRRAFNSVMFPCVING